MRLAVFTNQFPTRVSTFFARDIRGLLEAGVEVDIFPFYPVDQSLWRYIPDTLDERIFPRSKVHHINLTESLRSANFPPLGRLVKYIRDTTVVSVSALRFGIRPFAKSTYVLLKAWAAAQTLRGNYDHILSYWGNYAATYAYIFHRLTNERIPFSMFLHAVDLYQDQVYLRQKLLYADNIFVVCDFNRQYISEHYKDVFERLSKKIHVYHPGLDLAAFPYEPAGCRSRRVLGVGRFDKCKGFDYLVRATHYLTRLGLDVELELIGDGKEADRLKALARELSIDKKIRFRGWLQFNEVRDAMRQASILVHPSSELGDAVPTVIKEAFALGTAVIASKVAGIPELLDNGKCGILVPPRDVKALANAMKMLLTDDLARRTYADAARRYAEEKFDVLRNGQHLANILRSTTRLPLQGN